MLKFDFIKTMRQTFAHNTEDNAASKNRIIVAKHAYQITFYLIFYELYMCQNAYELKDVQLPTDKHFKLVSIYGSNKISYIAYFERIREACASAESKRTSTIGKICRYVCRFEQNYVNIGSKSSFCSHSMGI